MIRQVVILISLLAAYAYLSLGQGALGAVLLRTGAQFEFSDLFLGGLVSVMYFGFMVGNVVLRRLLPRISYIRSYIFCAATMGICAFTFPLLPFEYTWALLRFIYGLFFFTSVVLLDTWFNSVASVENRGRILGMVWTVNFIAYGLSQYILLVDTENVFPVFVMVGLVFIISLLPICLTRLPEPVVTESQASADIKIISAYKIAPIAMSGQFFTGMTAGATWLFIRYAEELLDSVSDVSDLAALFWGSGFLLQYVIGMASDRVKDRRVILMVVYVISALAAVGLFFGAHFSYPVLLVLTVIFGSFSVTSYALNISYGQDFASHEQRAGYSARLFQAYALGAFFGPLIAGYVMDSFSAVWLFAFIAVVLAVIASLTFTDKLAIFYVAPQPTSFSPVAQAKHGYVAQEDSYNEFDVGPTVPASEEATVSEVAEVGPTVQASDGAEAAAPEHPGVVGPSLPEDREETTPLPQFVFPPESLKSDGKR